MITKLSYLTVIGLRSRHSSNEGLRYSLALCESIGVNWNIHVAQSPEARAEIKELSDTSTLFISPQNSTCTAKIVQDSLLASFFMTKENDDIPKDRFWNICSKLINVDGSKVSIDDIMAKIARIDKLLRKLS